MTWGHRKSRTMRRVHVKTPGAKTVLHYRRRKPNKAQCAGCGIELRAVPRLRDYKMRNIAKTKKRPQRPFGGYFCSKCSRAKIVEMARKL